MTARPASSADRRGPINFPWIPMFEIELTALRLKWRPGWFAPRMSVPQHYLLLRCALGLKSLFSR
jgi:hypothetical protein